MKTFLVENFGEVGEANLSHGVLETQGKPWWDIEIGESTNVLIQNDYQAVSRVRYQSDKKKGKREQKLTRITRTK